VTTGLEPNPYERAEWRATGDGLLRPGGLALTDRAIKYCALPAGSRVWDIGCGLGVTVAHLVTRHGLEAVGVDRSEALLDAARSRTPSIPLICARGDALPCAAATLDAVLAECSWSVISTDRGGDRTNGDVALAECWRVLRPGGWLIISDVYARGVASIQAAPLGDGLCRNLLTEAEIRTALASQGFAIELWEDHSAALNEFVGRMIFEFGSLSPLWGDDGDGPEGCTALKAARPGYFLLAARRNG
jgi:SAM-dependent methyltransferase